MADSFKYTDEFFKEFEEKYMPKAKSERPKIVKKKKRNYKGVLALITVLLVILIVVLIIPKNTSEPQSEQNLISQEEYLPAQVEKASPYKEPDEYTVKLGSDINSEFAVLISVDTGEILAQKNYNKKMYPASLTKVMTLLVALENITDLNDTYEMSYLIIDPLYRQGASLAGFSSGEKVKIIDLLYGVILPSGADATCAIANYISGSEAEFVNLMNDKVKQLGLENTHFANSSGLYDDDNYTTAYDMALILKEAVNNEMAKKILSTSQYTTSFTAQHPEGIWMDSTLSHYIKGNEPENKTVIIGGKTGYVSQSGNCIASFAVSDTMCDYICVTGKAESGRNAAKDHINIYTSFAN